MVLPINEGMFQAWKSKEFPTKQRYAELIARGIGFSFFNVFIMPIIVGL